MAKSKAPRKKYVPKTNAPAVLRFSEEDMRDFQLMPHAELFNLRNGVGTTDSWDTLEMRFKWGMSLAKLHQQAHAEEFFKQVMAKLGSVHERFASHQQYDLDTDESEILGEGLTLADDLQLISTRREVHGSLNQALVSLRKNPYPTGRLNCFVAAHRALVG